MWKCGWTETTGGARCLRYNCKVPHGPCSGYPGDLPSLAALGLNEKELLVDLNKQTMTKLIAAEKEIERLSKRNEALEMVLINYRLRFGNIGADSANASSEN